MMLLMSDYIETLTGALQVEALGYVEKMAHDIFRAWSDGKKLFICGNGGSAGNSIHLANDFLYGVGCNSAKLGVKVESLNANQAVITCLANDIGYEAIFSEQLKVKAGADDVLLVLSGSGNSENIVKALKIGNLIGMNTYAILGFDGGECKKIARVPIHFDVHDMQISEDIQLIVGHMCMRWLSNKAT